MMSRTLTTALALALTAAPALPAKAWAQDAPGQWSFGFGAATDNRSKGASKTQGQEYVWVSAEWESDSGLYYVGGDFEGVDSSGSDIEGEVNFGLRPEGGGFDLDLSVAHKWLLDANPGTDDGAWEYTADVSRSIGPASGRIRLQYSPDSLGSTEAWTWVEARAGWAWSPTVKTTAAIGRREQDNAIDYTGYNAGVNWKIGRNADLDVRWYGTDGPSGDPRYADAVVAAISFGF